MSEQFTFTTNRVNWFLVICLALATCIINAEAQDTGEWVAAEITRSLPGQENISGKDLFFKEIRYKGRDIYGYLQICS